MTTRELIDLGRQIGILEERLAVAKAKLAEHDEMVAQGRYVSTGVKERRAVEQCIGPLAELQAKADAAIKSSERSPAESADAPKSSPSAT